MAVPNSRQTFKDYCLRKLGAPVLDINLDDDQVEDRIDEALNKYGNFHFDGTEKIYMKHQLTQAELDNGGAIVLPDLVIGVVNMFELASIGSADSLFNVQYQFALNDLFNIQSTQVMPYYLAMQHLDLLNYFFGQQTSVRFNFHTGILQLDSVQGLIPGQFIVVECYRILDPAIYSKVWSDIWLQNYSVALLKQQWGQNLGKFTITLPSGITYNGDKIYQQASDDIKKLEDELIDTWSLPVNNMIG